MRTTTIEEYRQRLSVAVTQASERADAIERNGGSSEEIREASAKTDAYSDAFGWLQSVVTSPASADGLKETVEAAVLLERNRCAEICNLAREGVIDTDLRSVRSAIQGGSPIEEFRRMRDI